MTHRTWLRLIVLAALGSLALPSLAIQPGGGDGPRSQAGPGRGVERGPEWTAERLTERVDERIVEMEKALGQLRAIRADLIETGDVRVALDELGEAFRSLIASGPMGEALRARRDGDGAGFDRGRWSRADRDGRDGGPGEPPAPDVTDAEIRAFIQARLPELGERLRRVNAFSEQGGERLFRRVRGRIAELVALEREDADMATLKLAEMKAGMRVVEAAGAYRRAESSGVGVDAAREELRLAMGEQFDAHLAMRAHEVTRTRARIAALETELTDQAARKEAFLDEKVGAMIDNPPRWMLRDRDDDDAPDRP